jgi:anti-sigma regulatory factor (Ser/Thr protein kinase)
LDALISATPPSLQILNFALTEMVNNALAHSKGSTVEVRWFSKPGMIAFEVEDDGVGAFSSIRQARGLADDCQAVGELARGKQTADAAHPGGLGIILTSQMVLRFTISANQLVWSVDNELGDSSIGWLLKPRVGTLARCEIRVGDGPS